MTKKKSLNRDYWIDLLKILACFLVVVNHTYGYIIEFGGNTLGHVVFYTIEFTICKIGVPIFIMVSGYLLLKRSSDYKDILKKIFRIFVPLLIFSLFLFFKYCELSFSNLKTFIITFLKDPIALPYWYLYMLIGLYLVTPFIQKMVKNFEIKDFRIFVIICLIVPSFISVLIAYFKINISSYLLSAIFPICIGYYVAGLYLSKIELNKKYRNIAILTFLIFILVLALSIIVPYVKTGELSLSLDSYSYITTVLPSLSIFYLLRYFFENRTFGDKSKRIIVEISNVTFGIYLLHVFLIYYHILDLNLFKPIFEFNAYLGAVCLEGVVFILSGLITYILRKIPVVHKFI